MKRHIIMASAPMVDYPPTPIISPSPPPEPTQAPPNFTAQLDLVHKKLDLILIHLNKPVEVPPTRGRDKHVSYESRLGKRKRPNSRERNDKVQVHKHKRNEPSYRAGGHVQQTQPRHRNRCCFHCGHVHYPFCSTKGWAQKPRRHSGSYDSFWGGDRSQSLGF